MWLVPTPDKPNHKVSCCRTTDLAAFNFANYLFACLQPFFAFVLNLSVAISTRSARCVKAERQKKNELARKNPQSVILR